MSDTEFVTHSDPAWRSRANFIAHGRVHGVNDHKRTYEQLWTRDLGNSRFELCCIPYFLYNVNLGDHVELGPDGDLQHVLKRVVHDGGHSTFRFYCVGEASLATETLQKVVMNLKERGCCIEHEGNGYVAADAQNATAAESVSLYLGDLQRRGVIRLETGRQHEA
jgi:hypothetical protein